MWASIQTALLQSTLLFVAIFKDNNHTLFEALLVILCVKAEKSERTKIKTLTSKTQGHGDGKYLFVFQVCIFNFNGIVFTDT